MTVDRLLPLTLDLEVATPAQPPRFLLVHVSHLFLFFFLYLVKSEGGVWHASKSFCPTGLKSKRNYQLGTLNMSRICPRWKSKYRFFGLPQSVYPPRPKPHQRGLSQAQEARFRPREAIFRPWEGFSQAPGGSNQALGGPS